MAYNTVQWRHFDNDDRRYEAYVLIDENDGAIIYNYQVWPGDYWLDILNDAIEDAREEQRHNKYGSYGVYGCINNEYDESTRVFITNGLNESVNDYIDKDGNHHRKFIDEDTGEEIDIIIDDEDFKNNHYEYDSSFDLFDDSDDEYVSNPEIEELKDEYNDIVTELRDLKRRRKLLMIDMENDPDVINDLDGDVAQEYGLELGNIDEEIERLQNRKKEIDKEILSLEGLSESVNEGRLQGYPIPGYRAAYNPADFDDVDIDITKIDERERILKKAEKMITTEYFPVPDNRTRIRLSDNWSIILSNTLFNNTTEFMGAVSISLGYKNNKEYCYENGRLYKDYNDMLDVIERVINRVNNGYFEPYIYDKVDKMVDIRYSDRSYKNVKYYDVVDESVKLNKNDKALLESLILKYGKNTLMIKMRNIF